MGGADRTSKLRTQFGGKCFLSPPLKFLSKGCLHSHACRDPYTHKYWGSVREFSRSKTRQRPLRCNFALVPDLSEVIKWRRYIVRSRIWEKSGIEQKGETPRFGHTRTRRDELIRSRP
ncbi:hypothetical protein TNCV_4336931 [Trichonephila clavipes]|nr:hypothetical protein TNCV_4336931 [Trichonephila clavipes]